MWERTLQDLIRGLRANKKDEPKFIAKAVDEIRREVRSDDMELKAGAVLKLTYLDMLGYDMNWASFNIVEVMSSPKYHLKIVGYLAAIQSFDQDTDVLMLTTNLLKKDLTSSPQDVVTTLNGISHIVTPELGRDLSPEVIRLLTHSRPAIRKRAVLALYKVMVRYPDVTELAIERMKEKLDDPDPGVVAATVNVLCEIARKHPKSLLTLAPPLFHLMTTSSNNWMLIKIIKLFGSLTPHEPRLVKKLQPPITDLISTTPAISLLYECVHTCITGGMLQSSSGDALARMCVSKLAGFIQDADQNLKYIALLAMVKIVPSHPYLVADYQDTILASVNDQDISIRMRALDLVSAMVNRDNLQSIVQQVLVHLVADSSSPVPPTAAQSLAAVDGSNPVPVPQIPPSQSPSYRRVLCRRILTMCSQNTYENVSNFEWYLSVLVDLANVANVDIGAQIRDQLVDVVARVRGARRYAVKLMYSLLCDDAMLRNANDEGSCPEVLWAAAWICGEYCSELVEPQKLLPYLLQPEISNLSPDIIAVYIQASAKIFGHWAAEVAERWTEEDLVVVKDLVGLVITQLRDFVNSPDIEVQERAANTLQLFTFIQADLNAYRPKAAAVVDNPFAEVSASFDPVSEPRFPKSMYLIQPLFSGYELNPVASNAQANVPIPEGLNLDVWIIPPAVIEPEEKKKKIRKGKGKDKDREVGGKGKKKREDRSGTATPEVIVVAETAEEREERERRKAERLERLRDDPYYIVDEPPSKPTAPNDDDIESIPVVKLEGLEMPLLTETVDPRLPLLREISQHPSHEPFFIDREGEMPEGAVATPPQQRTLASFTPSATPPTLSSFPQYEVPGEDGATANALEPIKVTRVKKKGTGTGKKKRTKAKDTPTVP